MAYVQHDLGLLVRLRPGEATAQILAAYRQAGGVARGAAILLGVNRSTLRRWVTKLERGGAGIRQQIERIRARAGC